jgi:hypothetical protein
MIWVLRLFGYPVLTFGPELLGDESEEELHIGNTGGSFTLADGPYSTDFAGEEEWIEEDNSDFGFRS